MIKKVLKWTGIVLGCLLLLLICAYAYAYFSVDSRATKVYEVSPKPVTIPTDSISIAKGEHLANIRGCIGCHNADFAGGRAFADESSPIGVLYSSNITSGKGGISYTDEDWIRALRHGLGKDKRALWFMPSHEIYKTSNEDLACIIAYSKSLPPVDKTNPAKSLKPLGTVLTFLGEFPLFPAEMIDHNATFANSVTPAITPKYGAYLAITCTGCHSENFKGGPAHGPEEPPAPDITSAGNPGKWNEAQFTTLMRTGKTPEGKTVSDAMPWKLINYTDDELKAVFAHLQRLK